MKRKPFLAMIVAAALLLGCCGVTAGAAGLGGLIGRTRPAGGIPEAAGVKLQSLSAAGGTIKADTKYDAVYQNGDEIYMGPDGLAPYGWTKLYTTH